MDAGATDHIIVEFEKLIVQDKYTGNEQVHAALVTLVIAFCIPTNSSIHLNNVLHVPQASKSLIFVNRLACDNNAFLEFHPNHFLIKEQRTKRTFLRGRCEGGLYPVKFRLSSNKQGLGVCKPSASLWHSKLEHASTSIVLRE